MFRREFPNQLFPFLMATAPTISNTLPKHPHFISLTKFIFILLLFSISNIHAASLSRQLESACTVYIDASSSRKLLQVDGMTDDLISFSICPPANFDVVNFQIFSSSSSTEVLPSSAIEISSAFALPCVNGSVSLIFDAMVGVVDFSLSAVLASSRTDSYCSKVVKYIIAGLTVYETRLSNSMSFSSSASSASSASFLVNNLQTSPDHGSVVAVDGDPSIEYVIRSGSDNAFFATYRNEKSSPLLTYDVRIQFPDGSSHSTRSPDDVVDAISSLSSKIPGIDAASPVRFNSLECQDFAIASQIDSALPNDDADCGVAIALRGATPTLALRLQPFKDGAVNMSISWPNFTASDDDLNDELFSTIVSLQVIGGPQPLVEAVSAPGVMYRAGGQIVTVVFDNAAGSSMRTLKVGNEIFMEVPGSYGQLENGLYEAQFVTAAANGTELPWILEVSFENADMGTDTGNSGGVVDEAWTRSNVIKSGVPSALSYANAPLVIESLFPPWGNDSEVVTLQGFFDGFNPTRDGHHIYIGDKTASELGIVPTVDIENGFILLPVPQRVMAGSAYEYPIRVVINNETTQASNFVYVPETLNVDISVFGGSYSSDMGEYILGTCEFSRYVAMLPSGVGEPPVFKWSLITRINGDVVDMLSSYESALPLDRKSLTLEARVFAGRSGVFVLSVSVALYGQELDKTVTLRITGVPVIGVTLPVLPERNLAVPDVPVRIDAMVTLPDDNCFRVRSEVMYEWTYNNETWTFSQSNMTDVVEDNMDAVFGNGNSNVTVRVTRIGRELIIPQSKLQYGNSFVSLLVYLNNNSFVSGNAETSLKIVAAELIPIIGFGAVKMVHNTWKDLTVTAVRSLDPDDLYRSGEGGIDSYVWDCTMSSGDDILLPEQSTERCSSDLLPSFEDVSFTVSTSALQKARNRFNLPNNESKLLLLHYSLKVGIGLVLSSSTFLSVQVIGGNKSREIPALDDIDVVNGRGTWIDRQRIRFYDDIVIAPSGANLTWSFSILSPSVDRDLFQPIGNLIVGEKYFSPEKNESQALPLGIRAGTLRPARAYDIVLDLHSRKEHPDNQVENQSHYTVVFRLRTVDAPKLVLPPMTITSGDFSTMFSASATVNLDSHGTFSFFFFLLTEDNEEFCLDGCSGRSIVQFRAVESGVYRLLVRLRDVQSTTVLVERLFDKNIMIISDSMSSNSSSPSTAMSLSLNSYSDMLRTFNMYGDHAMVQFMSVTLARQVRRLERNSTAALTDDGLEAISLAVQLLRDIVFNSIPMGCTARSYVQAVNDFARMAPQSLPSTDTMLMLISMVDAAVLLVPTTEALDMQEELLTFYNYSMQHILRPFAQVFFGIVVPTRILKRARRRSGKTAAILIEETSDNDERSDTGLSDIKKFMNMKVSDDGDDDEDAAAAALFRYFESMQNLLSIVTSRDAVCGSQKTVSTAVERGIPDESILSNIDDDNLTERARFESDSDLQSFVASFGHYRIPLTTIFTMVMLCDQNSVVVPRLDGRDSHVSWCNETVEWWEEEVEMLPEATYAEGSPEHDIDDSVRVTVEPEESFEMTSRLVEFDTSSNGDVNKLVAEQHGIRTKRIFMMMETMDYGWVGGLLEDVVKASTYVLVTTNLTDVRGGRLQKVDLNRTWCHSINMTVPRIGITGFRGCLNGNSFIDVKKVNTGASRRDRKRTWNVRRRFGVVKGFPSTDNSSSIRILSSRVGSLGGALSNCPFDTQLPMVPYPEIPDPFPHIVVGMSVAVSAAVTVAWTGTSAYYATFAGSGIT